MDEADGTQKTRAQEQQQFWATFHQLNWELHKHAMESLERIQLTPPQTIVLCILTSLGGRGTMCDLIERSFQSGPTLTRIMDRMVAAGLVTRERDEQDRRLVYILLTDAGRAAHERANAIGVADVCMMTEALSEDELAQMNALLHKLLAGMETVRAALHAPDDNSLPECRVQLE
jgi:MarR family transcriptional regulator, organic hydroperoxide resistance regulator